jgi:hypothetical protein
LNYLLAKIEKPGVRVVFQATAIDPVKSRRIEVRTPLKADLVPETSIDLSDLMPIKTNIPV